MANGEGREAAGDRLPESGRLPTERRYWRSDGYEDLLLVDAAEASRLLDTTGTETNGRKTRRSIKSVNRLA